ncbi:MAG TPA: SoxR reducing system RseC family protein [Ignavibacteriaceae bacterium]|nr:SoxR reducing system RseC family protein [Ignavibacteriaceae bacterium]
MSELIKERGIVVSKKDSTVEIELLASDHCKECSANVFCKGGEDEKKRVIVLDTIGCKSGDLVEFALPGNKLFSASIQIYGIPLVLLILTIILFDNIFDGNQNKELFSILISLGILGLYYVVLFMTSKDKIPGKGDLPVTVAKLRASEH